MSDTNENGKIQIQRFSSLQQALCSLFKSSTRLVHTARISGGDINDAFRLELNDGITLFMKANKKRFGSVS